MKAMCRAIHAMGLKAGIYSTPWMGTYAGFIGGSAPGQEGGLCRIEHPGKGTVYRRIRYSDAIPAFTAGMPTAQGPYGCLTATPGSGPNGDSIT